LRQAEAGRPVAELCRQVGIMDTTFYKWRSKFAGLEVSEARRLRQLEEENRRHKLPSHFLRAVSRGFMAPL
jgi:putative transposase